MKRNKTSIVVILLAFLSICLPTSAQTENILTQLAAYKVTPEVLTMAFNEDWPNVSLTRNIVSTTPGTDYIYKQTATYNANKPTGQKWTLVSVNDKQPENYNFKDFNYEMNPKKSKTILQVDKSTLTIVSEDENNLVVSFKYIPSSIPQNYAYLADCTSKANINKGSGTLEKLIILNDGPTKLKSMKISYVKFEIDYSLNTDLGSYVVVRNELNNTGTFLGATASNKSVSEYSAIIKLK